MRQRSVNEKAVSKLINYLTDLKKDLADGIYVTGHQLQTKNQVSKSTYSVCKKLEIIVNNAWNNAFDADRKTAMKILEFLRQQSDKQTDKPISDLWIAEIASIKELLTQVRDNTKNKESGLNRTKIPQIGERVYLLGKLIFPDMVLNPDLNEVNYQITRALSIVDMALKQVHK